MTSKMHECNMLFCENCKQNRDVDHLRYVRPLKNALASAGDKVFYVFYEFETTQNNRYSDKATLHVPALVCVQEFCARFEDVEDGDCVRCSKRKHSLWDDPYGDMLTYL